MLCHEDHGVRFVKWLIIRKGKAVFTVVSSLWHSAKEALQGNERVKEWIEKHPKTLFGGIVEDLITTDPIIKADIRVANLLALFRTDSLSSIFSWITLLCLASIFPLFPVLRK
jgi:hypothetical protein